MNEFIFKHIPKTLSKDTRRILRHIIFIMNMFIIMIPLTILFNNWHFMIIGTIIFNICNMFSYGYHCKNFDNCILSTNILVLIFGYIAKQSTDYLWVVFLLCVFSIKEIYEKTPLKIIVENKNEKWHKIQFIKYTYLFIIISIICLYCGYIEITNCILLSFVWSRLVLFINE